MLTLIECTPRRRRRRFTVWGRIVVTCAVMAAIEFVIAYGLWRSL